MTSMSSPQEWNSRGQQHLASAWGVAAATLIMMQGALLLSGPGACPAKQAQAAQPPPAKSDFAFYPEAAVGKSPRERYYRCFERPAEKSTGAFVIALACVWPGEDSSAGG